jgi:dTDP-4-amino-4,6-dideoxygalactose transaminase
MQQAIKMVDLAKQQNLIRPNLEQAISEVLNNGNYILGKQVFELEEKLAKFCQADFAVSCASGTDALEIVLKAKQVTSKDAIFIPAFTYTATAGAVVLAGATPVFVDVLPDSFNLDPNSLEQAITVAKQHNLHPAGIISVDLFGLPADYQRINNLAKMHNLWLLCDAAQSFGARYQGAKVGNFGIATATSFFPSKPLGCYGDGGCIFTNDAELADAFKSLRMHGAKILQGVADKYNNVRVGMNSRLDTMQAVVLLVKLNIFEQEIKLRNQVAEYYNQLFTEVFADQQQLSWPVIPNGYDSVWAQYTIKLSTNLINNKLTNQQLQAELKAGGVPSVIYYSKPISAQAPYAHFPQVDLFTAEQLSNQVLSLPMHPYLTRDQQQYIVNQVAAILSKY